MGSGMRTSSVYDALSSTPASERVVMVFSTERTEETEAEQLLYGDIVFDPRRLSKSRSPPALVATRREQM